jgi:hypothetical protein
MIKPRPTELNTSFPHPLECFQSKFKTQKHVTSSSYHRSTKSQSHLSLDRQMNNSSLQKYAQLKERSALRKDRSIYKSPEHPFPEFDRSRTKLFSSDAKPPMTSFDTLTSPVGSIPPLNVFADRKFVDLSNVNPNY